MRRRNKKLISVAVAAVMAAAGCGSSSKGTASGSSSGGGGGGKTYTIGVLTDLTGLASNTETTVPEGIKAGVGMARQEGYNIRYDVVDTQSSPTGALTAAKQLVDQDHAFLVVAISGLTFGAASFLASRHIPVVGVSVDSTEWITDSNMFSVLGTEDYTRAYSQYGKFFKMEGVTNLAAIGYNISPSSSGAAKGVAVAAQDAGVKVGYLNPQFPFGSTNVGPIALAMKSAGVDGIYTATETNTSIALISALRQEGVTLKAALPSTGYGGDLVLGGPGAQQAAQGVFFLTNYEPVEMHTAATQKFVKALKTYAGVTSEPTFAEYNGYVSIDAVVQGLKAAGANPTQEKFINAMLAIRSYNAAGLYGSHSVGFGMDQRGLTSGPDNCVYITRFEGSTFHLVPGADPLCGQTLPGKI